TKDQILGRPGVQRRAHLGDIGARRARHREDVDVDVRRVPSRHEGAALNAEQRGIAETGRGNVDAVPVDLEGIVDVQRIAEAGQAGCPRGNVDLLTVRVVTQIVFLGRVGFDAW